MVTALVCEECGRVNRNGEHGWQAHLVDLDEDDPDSGSEVLLFCPGCAEREFGIKGSLR